MRPLALLLAAAALTATTPASAALLITVDKTTQHMIVARNDQPLYDWKVSTGQRGYDTPSGVYQPFRMEKDHFSDEWDSAPMPNSIFFTKEGHAIHGSMHTKRLGSPASHGCVRLSPQNAEILWKLVREEKMANVRVVLTGQIPGGPGEKAPPRGLDPYGDDGLLSQGPPPGFRNRDPSYANSGRFQAWSSSNRPGRVYYFDERPRSGFGDIFR